MYQSDSSQYFDQAIPNTFIFFVSSDAEVDLLDYLGLSV